MAIIAIMVMSPTRAYGGGEDGAPSVEEAQAPTTSLPPPLSSATLPAEEPADDESEPSSPPSGTPITPSDAEVEGDGLDEPGESSDTPDGSDTQADESNSTGDDSDHPSDADASTQTGAVLDATPDADDPTEQGEVGDTADVDEVDRPSGEETSAADGPLTTPDLHESPPGDGDGPTTTEIATSEVSIESVAIATSNTGGNTSVSGGGIGTGSTVVRVDTGGATGVGNADTTEIAQQAVADLSGHASADIVQISVVVNIGRAVADTGNNNSAAGAASGGSLSASTGGALAIGNDSQTYVTQGSAADAAPGEIDTSSQRVFTFRVGVALASTGQNVLIATVSSSQPDGAETTTGDAVAVGNQSSTSIEQVARAVGSGTSQIFIEQRATVVNLGLAFANTGSNTIGDIGAMLLAPEGTSLDEILATLLPIMLAAEASAGQPSGGSISTGAATAVGNRSATAVKQVAVGAASGDGVARVQQDVVVVNGGVAVADTGNNSIGSGSTVAPARLDDDTQRTVAELALFLSSIVAQINAWADGTDTDVESAAMSAELAGGTIDISGELTPITPSIWTSDGLTARIRQLTAVISLGIASANSGRNTTIVGTESAAPTARTLAAATPARLAAIIQSEGVAVIVTGDATAANGAVIQACQLRDMPDLACLAPPVEVVPADEPPLPALDEPREETDLPVDDPATVDADTSGNAQPGDGGAEGHVEQRPPTSPTGLVQSQPVAGPMSLPATGTEVGAILWFGCALTGAGVFLRLCARRRAA